MKRQLIIALMATVAVPAAFAVTDAQLKAVKKSVSSVPVPELPAKAAELVTQAQKEDRAAVAETAVRAAIYKSRSSAPIVVAAVSKAAPEVAGSASRVAAEMEAGQSDSITAAASGAAPSAKSQIVSGVQQGAFGTVPSSTTSSSAFTPSFSPTPSTIAMHTTSASFISGTAPASASIAPSVSESSLTVRGAAKTQHGGHVEFHNTPINHEHGGDGHGHFPGQDRPGHGFGDHNHDHDGDRDDHHGRPPICDYTKPRHY
ncbi:MAG: hypothetical protein ACXWIU_11250 [Limisphaerales bacterium]